MQHSLCGWEMCPKSHSFLGSPLCTSWTRQDFENCRHKRLWPLTSLHKWNVASSLQTALTNMPLSWNSQEKSCRVLQSTGFKTHTNSQTMDGGKCNLQPSLWVDFCKLSWRTIDYQRVLYEVWAQAEVIVEHRAYDTTERKEMTALPIKQTE
jgi:hypothetical protein